ncbi:MAG: hypothetical protein PHW63_08265 [Alphaproteobacteria bacterium]|nr:hypothetical protein [Alphaproteobacteria bacterium]
MDQLEGLKMFLKESLALEIKAEGNCDKILHEARINGYYKAVEHIKNDERRHREMVERLLGML